MSETSIEARIAALEGRVSDIERQRWEGPPCLGPQPTKPDVEALTRMVMAATCMCCECQGKKCLTSHAGHSCGRSVIERPEPPPVDRSKVCTTSGEPAEKVRAEQTEETGQHKGYIVLCAEERAKGFVRPYRDAYMHVGRLQEMTNDANKTFTIRVGGCRTVTTMGRALSETYARDPKFYGSTFCVNCNRHLPVEEFTWTADGQQVGS